MEEIKILINKPLDQAQSYATNFLGHELDATEIFIINITIFVISYKIIVNLWFFYQVYQGKKVYSLKSKLFKLMTKMIPSINKQIEKKIKGMANEFYEDLDKQMSTKCIELPQEALDEKEIKHQLNKWYVADENATNKGTISGTRYAGDSKLENIVKECSKDFMYHNPLHCTDFIGTRQMEAEVISMTCKLLHNEENSGIITYGGTESILLAIFAARERAEQEKGISKPNIVLADTAHPAFVKACTYFKIEERRVKSLPDFTLDFEKMKKLVDKNTICIVAQSSNYPHGIQDNVPQIANFARIKGIPCHVDCCLGSFTLIYAKQAGQTGIYDFDFRVPGVTSISIDHHKFGLGPKGASMVVFKNLKYRHFAFHKLTNWPGGLYFSPSISGSRTATPIAGTWVAMRYHGQQGYLQNAKEVICALNKMKEAVRSSGDLELMGDAKINTFAFRFSKNFKLNLPIYSLNDVLHSKGWKLVALQNPPGIHVSVTQGMAQKADDFIRDLKSSLKMMKKNPEKYQNGSSVALYGACAKVPDPSIMEGALFEILDAILKI